jgi:hypothetical protein
MQQDTATSQIYFILVYKFEKFAGVYPPKKFEKLLHLVVFTVEIYCDARSYERQNRREKN